jgi:hypothetical protein
MSIFSKKYWTNLCDNATIQLHQIKDQSTDPQNPFFISSGAAPNAGVAPELFYSPQDFIKCITTYHIKKCSSCFRELHFSRNVFIFLLSSDFNSGQFLIILSHGRMIGSPFTLIMKPLKNFLSLCCHRYRCANRMGAIKNII